MERAVKKERSIHYINIPAEIRKGMNIHAGDRLDVSREDDRIIIRKVPVKSD